MPELARNLRNSRLEGQLRFGGNGLGQEFNSLDNRREASEASVKGQLKGWKLVRECYDGCAFRWKGAPFRSCWTMSKPEGST
jgi:hypothetical protein